MTLGLLVLSLGFVAGGAGAASVGWWGHGGSGSNNSTSNTTSTAGTWNVTSHHPVWNSGNLCNATRSGSSVWCVYDGSNSTGGSGYGYGGCGTCIPSLSYNFSGDHKTIYILVSNLSRSLNTIYLNVHGNHDTVYLNITTACSGGSVNMTVLGEQDWVYAYYNASDIKSTFAFYPDHDHFSAFYAGSLDISTTYFSEVGTKKQLCPYGNTSKSDTASVASSGYWDVQSLVWTNGVGYNSALHWMNMSSTLNGSGWWGPHSYVGFENTTSAWCGWSIAPPCSTYHHGHSWNAPVAGKAE